MLFYDTTLCGSKGPDVHTIWNSKSCSSVLVPTLTSTVSPGTTRARTLGLCTWLNKELRYAGARALRMWRTCADKRDLKYSLLTGRSAGCPAGGIHTNSRVITHYVFVGDANVVVPALLIGRLQLGDPVQCDLVCTVQRARHIGIQTLAWRR